MSDVGIGSLFSLHDKVAIVTGGAGGMGEVFVTALIAAGASVVVADIAGDKATVVAHGIEARGGKALGVAFDQSDPDSIQELVAAVIDRFGGVDILVNNAALMDGIPKSNLIDFPIDWWERVLRVNLTGVLMCMQAVAPRMIERGGGKIINISSGGAFAGRQRVHDQQARSGRHHHRLRPRVGCAQHQRQRHRARRCRDRCRVPCRTDRLRVAERPQLLGTTATFRSAKEPGRRSAAAGFARGGLDHRADSACRRWLGHAALRTGGPMESDPIPLGEAGEPADDWPYDPAARETYLRVVQRAPGAPTPFRDLTVSMIGRVWGRPHLTFRERRIIVITTLAMSSSPYELETHLRAAAAIRGPRRERSR